MVPPAVRWEMVRAGTDYTVGLAEGMKNKGNPCGIGGFMAFMVSSAGHDGKARKPRSFSSGILDPWIMDAEPFRSRFRPKE